MKEKTKPATKFLTAAKVKILFIITFVITLAALLGGITTIKEFFSGLISPKTTMTGTIITSEKGPAENAHVTLFLYGKNKSDSIITMADRKGGFSFTKLNKNKFDNFRIDVSWKDVFTSYENKFEVDVYKNGIIIQLPDVIHPESSNPLSFTYYHLKGHTIDYLLEGKIDPAWETKLSKHPYIIKNEIFNVLTELRKKFNYPNEVNSEMEVKPQEYVKKNKSDNMVDATKALSLSYYMAGTLDYTEGGARLFPPDDFITINESDVSLFVNETTKQKLKKTKREGFVYKWFPVRAELPVIKKAQVGDNRNKLIDWLMEITENYYPDSLIEAQLYLDDDPCVDGWIIELIPPSLSLKAVLIGNASSQTVTIGNFYCKENKVPALTIKLKDPASPGKLNGFNYFPIQKLKPNETIVLPLELVLNTAIKRPFTLGSAQTLQSMEIDNDNYAVRKEDTQNILMYEGIGGIGSCPYVYTFSKDQGAWLLEDHILYGYDAKEKEKEHLLPLKRFTGKLQLREIDPEISYLDYLYIKQTLPDGNIKMLKPDNIRLSEKDGNYLVLKRGDRILLDFTAEPNVKSTYSVISFGYYLRNK